MRSRRQSRPRNASSLVKLARRTIPQLLIVPKLALLGQVLLNFVHDAVHVINPQTGRARIHGLKTARDDTC